MPNMKHETYYDALRADDAFEQAIKAQFGEKATRWTVSHADYNAETLQAYKSKVQADWLRGEFSNGAS